MCSSNSYGYGDNGESLSLHTVVSQVMERGDLAEFGKNATQMMIFLPIENVGRKITKMRSPHNRLT